jgi:hypothetical protein
LIHSLALKVRAAEVVVCCVLVKFSPKIELRSGGVMIAVEEVCSKGAEKLLARYPKVSVSQGKSTKDGNKVRGHTMRKTSNRTASGRN